MRSKMMQIVGVLCLCSTLVLALSGCSSTGTTEKSGDSGVSMGVVNDTCPVMTNNAVDPAVATADYNGQKVGFCCPGCESKWAAKTDAEKQAFIDAEVAEHHGDASDQVNMGVINATCPVRGGKVNQAVNVDYKGQKVGFCCAGCIEGWNEMSDEEKAAFINRVHEEGDANLGAVGGAKEGACDGAKPCCSETKEPVIEEPVSPGAVGGSAAGGCSGGR